MIGLGVMYAGLIFTWPFSSHVPLVVLVKTLFPESERDK